MRRAFRRPLVVRGDNGCQSIPLTIVVSDSPESGTCHAHAESKEREAFKMEEVEFGSRCVIYNF